METAKYFHCFRRPLDDTLRQYESGADKRTLHAFVWLTFGGEKREKIRYTCIKRTGGKVDFFPPSPPGFCNNLNLFELVENCRAIGERKRLKNICQLFGNIYHDFRSDFHSLYKVDIDRPSHLAANIRLKLWYKREKDLRNLFNCSRI